MPETDHLPEPPPEVLAEQAEAAARYASIEAALRPGLDRLRAEVEAERTRRERECDDPAGTPATVAELLLKLDTPDVQTAYEQAHRLGVRVWELAGDREDGTSASVLELALELLDEPGLDALTDDERTAALALVEHPEPAGYEQRRAEYRAAYCVQTTDNDMQAFAELPDCEACDGCGKRVPPDWYDDVGRLGDRIGTSPEHPDGPDGPGWDRDTTEAIIEKLGYVEECDTPDDCWHCTSQRKHADRDVGQLRALLTDRGHLAGQIATLASWLDQHVPTRWHNGGTPVQLAIDMLASWSDRGKLAGQLRKEAADRDQLAEDLAEARADRDQQAASASLWLKGAVEAEGLKMDLDGVTAERDRYRQHSVTLNTIAWKLATALGDVPDGAEQIEGNPLGQAERLIAELAEMQQLFDLAYQRTTEATTLWRAEAPEERALIQPDLGALLTWLMERGDTARRELNVMDNEAGRLHGLLAERGRLEEIGQGLREQIRRDGAADALAWGALHVGPSAASTLRRLATSTRAGELEIPTSQET